ncbi:MAG: flagellar biosynthesis anti-sigma factor FlgM [Pseudomonadota bacterium]
MDIKGLNTNNLKPDGNQSGSGVQRRNDTARADAAGNQGNGNTVKNDDAVTLTGAAQAMNATAGASESAPFDAARVAELRSAISEGNYPVNNQELADRMIELEALLR